MQAMFDHLFVFINNQNGDS